MYQASCYDVTLHESIEYILGNCSLWKMPRKRYIQIYILIVQFAITAQQGVSEQESRLVSL
jgi:hypothetical protein